MSISKILGATHGRGRATQAPLYTERLPGGEARMQRQHGPHTLRSDVDAVR